MMKCMCGMCPVQAESSCSRPKMQMMMDMRNKMASSGSGMGSNMTGSMSIQANPPEQQMSSMMPKVEELPGPYCSISTALCKDLDRNKTCICTTCQVYKDFSLAVGKPVEHYCFNGRAT